MTTWPNPAAPGVPENAGEPLTEAELEAAAQHVLENSRRGNAAASREQFNADTAALLAAYRDIISKAWTVLARRNEGPVYTAAQVEAARREENERCAKWHDAKAAILKSGLESTSSPLLRSMRQDGVIFHETCARELRALPTAPAPALDAVVQRAREEVDAAATFLLERIENWSEDNLTDDTTRDWFGHVEPAIGRLRAAIRSGAAGGRTA